MIGLISLIVVIGIVVGVAIGAIKKGLPVAELLVVAGIALALTMFGPLAIDEMTSGRGSPDETLPWLMLSSVVILLGWLFLRRPKQQKSSVSRQRDATAPRPRSAPRPKPAPRETTPPPQREHSIFISYRRDDSADVTGRIYDRLVQSFGSEHVYKDVDTVPLGVDFREHIDLLVSRCDALLAVIGPTWLDAPASTGARRLDDARDLVRIEIASALARNIPVIPVLVRGGQLPGEGQLPDDLQALTFRNGIPVRADPDFHNDVGRLISGLAAHFES